MTALTDHLDDDTPCGQCGHAHGWHQWPTSHQCEYEYGTPDQCECVAWERPIS